MYTDFNEYLLSLGITELTRDLEKKFTMFVKNYDDTKWGKKQAFPAIVMEKFDGVCALLVGIEGDFNLFSRTGRLLCNVNHLSEQFVGISHYLNNTVTMVEVCNDELSLEQISGIVNPNRNKPIEDELESIWMNHSYLAVYDQVLLSEFLLGKSEVTFEERFKDVVGLVELLKLPLACPQWIKANSEEEMETFFDRITYVGGEGVVIAQLDAPWIAGYKNHHKTKRVRGFDIDLLVTGVVEGKGKRAGTMAKVTVQWRKFADLKNPVTELAIDGRFNDEERAMYFENPELIVGKIVHVHALQLGSAGSMRLAKVRSVRMDKFESDL